MGCDAGISAADVSRHVLSQRLLHALGEALGWSSLTPRMSRHVNDRNLRRPVEVEFRTLIEICLPRICQSRGKGLDHIRALKKHILGSLDGGKSQGVVSPRVRRFTSAP